MDIYMPEISGVELARAPGRVEPAALQRMLAQPGSDIVRQRVVDGGFHFAVESQAAAFRQLFARRLFGAVADIVGQCLRVPGGKYRFGGEVLVRGIGLCPDAGFDNVKT